MAKAVPGVTGRYRGHIRAPGAWALSAIRTGAEDIFLVADGFSCKRVSRQQARCYEFNLRVQ